MTVRWSPDGASDLEEIYDYIAADDADRAASVVRRIYQQVATLAQFPRGGRPGAREGTRELILQRLPFMAVYEVRDTAVVVVRILHGARPWP